ncbi:unnamed protein product, partial [Effrenium voratum]
SLPVPWLHLGGPCCAQMRRRGAGRGLEPEDERIPGLQQVLHFGAAADKRSTSHGPPPPLASAICAFLGACAAARLGRCAVGFGRFTPTGLQGPELRTWAGEHWPAASVDLPGTGEAAARLAALVAPSADASLVLDVAFAFFARQPITALEEPDVRGQRPLQVLARRKCPALLRLLLDFRAEVNAAGRLDGRCALHHAAQAGDAQSVRWLLAARADPQRRDDLRMLPLDVAARVRAEEVQEALLAAMAPAPTCSAGCCVT